MGFKKVLSLECDTTIALGGRNKETGKENSKSIEGYYLGKKETANKMSKTGLSNIYIFQTKSGVIGVWGKTNLDRQMPQVTPGNMTRVTFAGTVPTNTGNNMYKYTVEQDSENTIDVGTVTETLLVADEASDDYAPTDYSEGALDHEEDALDEVETPVVVAAKKAATPDAARAAKVQALLNGAKNARRA